MRLNARQCEQVRTLIEGIDTAMLTTVTSDGLLRSRPMAAPPLTEDGELLFFTRADTPKIREIVYGEQVNIDYVAPQENRYVSVSGRARILDDRKRARRFWSEELSRWFAGGVDDPALRLIDVEIERIDFWDESKRRMSAYIQLAQPPAHLRTEEDEWNDQWLGAQHVSDDVNVAYPVDEPPD